MTKYWWGTFWFFKESHDDSPFAKLQFLMEAPDYNEAEKLFAESYMPQAVCVALGCKAVVFIGIKPRKTFKH